MSEFVSSWEITDEVTVCGELGRGSYGKVCVGDWKGAPVAVKTLHDIFFEVSDQPGDVQEFVKQFEAEWERLKKLRHPNIVQLFGVAGINSNRPLMVTELMDESLEHRIASGPKLDQSTQLYVLRNIACGLRYMHELPEGPLIHRDLASKNILLANDCCRVKIADLGVAKTVGLVQRGTTVTGNFKPGTDVYMPPEVMLRPGTLPHPSLDIFSYGVVILETISGEFLSPRERIEPIPGRLGEFRLVPEVERRQPHIDMIESIHPLLKLVLDCLNDRPEMRPSSSQILQRIPKVAFIQQSRADLTEQVQLLQLENQTLQHQNEVMTLDALAVEAQLQRVQRDYQVLQGMKTEIEARRSEGNQIDTIGCQSSRYEKSTERRRSQCFVLTSRVRQDPDRETDGEPAVDVNAKIQEEHEIASKQIRTTEQMGAGMPMRATTTDEYDDMLKNLPAVAIARPKRTCRIQSHCGDGDSYDDSDPVVSSLSSSTIARDAITVPRYNEYGSSQNIMYHPSDAHESETAAHQLDEEHSIEVSGMYGSGGEDDDVADLKSLIGRAKMHESDLSMVESSRFHDDQQEDDTYQCPQSQALGNYESHIDYRPGQQMNEADIRHHFGQPLAGGNKDVSTGRHTRQGHDNQINVCRAQEQVSASDYRSDPTLDPNRLSELHQRQHNSALVTENGLNATSVVEQALEQLTPNLPSQRQPSDQLEEHLFNSPESALHGTERLSYRKEGRANSQQLGSVELHTAKGGGDDASGEYAAYSLDNKTGAITETPSFINKGVSTNGGENESPRIDNGRYDHIDAMTLKTKRGQLDVHGNDDTKPVGPDIKNIKYKPRDHIPSVAERDSGAATNFTASGRSRSYAAVAATLHEMAPQQVESKGRPSSGVAQPVALFWKCVHCTYVNCAGASVCSMCSKTRNFQVKASLDSNEKECRSCTLMNPAEARVCKACGQPFNLLDLPKLKETAMGPYLESTV